MNDRELLEMAAKAAGFQGSWRRHWRSGSASYMVFAHPPRYVVGRQEWNPLDDDGDCARMEMELGIQITWHSDGVVCGKRWSASTELFDDHGGDKQAARRMASLRVAAEIGKAMP